MRRALVTGGDGFVGRYLCAELRERGISTVVAGRSAEFDGVDVVLELADAAGVRSVVETARADVVFHLAAQAFVPLATADPLGTYETNVLGTARLVEAIRALPPANRPRLLLVSSGEVYGVQAPGAFPLGEAVLPHPMTVYAASKLAAEAVVLASAYTFGLRAVVTRAFNHIGPGQSDRFAVAAFAQRLAQIAHGEGTVLQVGNLTPERDFLDVRDVVRAYVELALHGASGELYNVCSGVPTRISDLLRTLVTVARVAVEIREDPALLRPADVPVLYGDNRKLKDATGWEPRYSLAASLRDVYRAALAETAAK